MGKVLTFVEPEKWKNNYSEAERKGMTELCTSVIGSLNAHLDEVLNDPSKSLDMDKIKGLIEEGCKGQLEGMVDPLKSAIEAQKKQLQKLKEFGTNPNFTKGKENVIKAQFDANFTKLQEEFRKNAGNEFKTPGITLVPRTKAIDEHIPERIITTANVTTAGSDDFDWLVDTFGERTDTFRKRRPLEYIRDILTITRVENVPEAYIWTEEGDEVGAFAVVAENALKPQIFLNLVKYVVNPVKVAGYMVVTEEVIKFRSRTWAKIRELFRTKFEREYNRLLNALLTESVVAYPGTTLDGTFANPTDVDAIGAVAAAIENLNFVPDTIIINPQDKWRILLQTNDNGTYVFLPFIRNGDQPELFGFRMITSNYVPAGTFYLGESGSIFVEEETPYIRTGWANDDIIHNRMVIILENWFIGYVPTVNEGSWMSGNFADIKDALQV